MGAVRTIHVARSLTFGIGQAESAPIPNSVAVAFVNERGGAHSDCDQCLSVGFILSCVPTYFQIEPDDVWCKGETSVMSGNAVIEHLRVRILVRSCGIRHLVPPQSNYPCRTEELIFDYVPQLCG